MTNYCVQMQDCEKCQKSCPQANMAYDIAKGRMYAMQELCKIVKEIENGDLVHVVRCRNCENWETGWKPNHSIDGEHFCPMISLVTSGEWFCAYGERMDGE